MTEPKEPTEPTNAHLLSELQAVKRGQGRVEGRMNTMENARTAARGDYEVKWTSIQNQLERIELQTTRTNGRVTHVETEIVEARKLIQELREWKSFMTGVATSFSWWKPAVATLAAAAVFYLFTH